MKKVLSLALVFWGFIFPLVAQVDHDYNPNDRVPEINLKITKNQVPDAVIKAVNTQFQSDKPETWSKFPYALKEYGWVYDVGASDLQLNRYEVTLTTSNGDELWAVYGAEGNLVETRELLKNSAMPQKVQLALANSQYKDWTIVGNKELIKYYHDGKNSSVEQHYRITVQKDNVKRSISFNYQQSSDK